MPRFGIVVFPGSNCDHDCYHAIKHILNQQCEFVWHEERSLDGFDCVVIPGGFSYGDYLRPGAIARFSPIMQAIKGFASDGKPVIGICNGFQILVEAKLLPGAFLRNASLKFICRWVNIRVENTKTPFTCLLREGTVLRIPIAHGEGNYFISLEELNQLRKNSQIVFRYCNTRGEITSQSNPNGSIENIAGVCNPEGNVLGMMPHPERCCEDILGGHHGKLIFQSVIYWISQRGSKRGQSQLKIEPLTV